MDNLVLIRVAAALDRALGDAVLQSLREGPPGRFHLTFAGPREPVAVQLSLRPEMPWIGRTSPRGVPPQAARGPFAALAAGRLEGRSVTAVRKPGPGREIEISFRDGERLVAELATHGANLVLLDADGRVTSAALRPRSAAARLAEGTAYAPPKIPPGKLLPFGASPEAIDAFLAAEVARGEEGFEALRRGVFGVGTAGASLVFDEAARRSVSAGTVLAERLTALERGAAEPVVEADEDPRDAAEAGRFDTSSARLLPWLPETTSPGRTIFRREDAAATAALFHDAAERAAVAVARAASLVAILRRETRRTRDAETRARHDLMTFEDPERWRRQGEALLAGLTVAKRYGSVARVPDPYDPDGGWVEVEAEAGAPLTAAADALFKKHRRARRGAEAAARRVESMSRRREALERVAAEHGEPRGAADVERLTEAMRGLRIAVGFAAATRKARARDTSAPLRVEGVRMLVSRDGIEVLVGKTARDNERLTFRLAQPEDFWLHAHGVPGAHVVVRNAARAPHPPRATLEEAAAWAAWFSDAKGQAAADVAWTRRKHVRRARGAGAGTVLLKRFEIVRVRPAPPPNDGGGP